MVSRLQLKKDAIPHIFECQEDRERMHKKQERQAVTKRKRQSFVKDSLEHQSSIKNVDSTEISSNLDMTSEVMDDAASVNSIMQSNKDFAAQVNTFLHDPLKCN